MKNMHCCQHSAFFATNTPSEGAQMRGTTRPAMFNPNGLLSQKSCHYLNQGRTLNDILMRAAD